MKKLDNGRALGARRYSYQLRMYSIRRPLAGTTARPQLGSCGAGDFLAANGILRDVLRMLDRTLGVPPNSLSLQGRPFLRPRAGYWNTIEDDFHWHLEILPQIERINGFERTSGFSAYQ